MAIVKAWLESATMTRKPVQGHMGEAEAAQWVSGSFCPSLGESHVFVLC